MLFIPLEVIPYFALFHSFSGGKVIMKTPCWILIALSQPYFKKVVHFHFSFTAFISPGISNNRLSLFSFRQVEMIEYLQYLFSVLWEDGMSSRSFFRTAAGVRKNWRPIGMFYLPLFFKGLLFYASGFCAHFFSSPSSPPKTSENRVSRTRKWSKLLFQFPTPLIWCHISHPSINSQPSCVGVGDSMNTLNLLAEDTEIVPTSVKVFTVVVIVLIRYNVVWTSRWRNIYLVFSGQGSMEKLVQCVSGDMMSVKGTVVHL